MTLTQTQNAQLTRYANEIVLYNGARNLVKAETADEIFEHHINDCIAGAEAIAAEIAGSLKNAGGGCGRARICDAGSGAGFPGIPLAVVLPQFDFVLVEAMQSRSVFLESCAALLALQNVTVVNSPIEAYAARASGMFDCITFRAFRSFDKIEKKTFAALKKMLIPQVGFIAAYKGKRQTIDTEIAALKTQTFSGNFCCRIENIGTITRERNIVFLQF